MARKKAEPTPPLIISEWERDVLHASCMIQVDRYWKDEAKADRWREIATAVRNGRPIAYSVREEG